ETSSSSLACRPSVFFLAYSATRTKKQAQGLDKAEDGTYDASIMDSAMDRRSVTVVLSSLLWNWWAVPTAR
ncbi:MAG: hypothetical protein ACXWFO_09875, partial [Candidatus Aminicenantales bacterium]